MVKKLLLSTLLLLSIITQAQKFNNDIALTGLPLNGGSIIGVTDYNNDGQTDVIFSPSTGNLQLYRNNSGVFQDVTASALFPSIATTGTGNQSAIPFDYNGDGFVDLLIAESGSGKRLILLKNNCGSTFQNVSSTANMPSSINVIGQAITNDPMILISDYDRDNDNDIVLARLQGTTHRITALNNNNGVFSSSDILTNILSTQSPYFNFLDYDRDNDDDLVLIRNSNLSGTHLVEIYENNGTGLYTVNTTSGLTNSSPLAFATVVDVNNDGFDDLLLGTKEVVSPGPGNLGNKVFRNNGDATFTEITSSFNTYQSTILGDNFFCHVFDIDNDGDNDVLWEVRSNGSILNQPAMRINNGTGNFSAGNQLTELIIDPASNDKLVVFDYNNDGKLDIFGKTPSGNAMLTNNTTGGNYLKVKLLSCAGQGVAIGTKVFASAGGLGQHKSFGLSQSQTSTSSTEEWIHFGLGSATTVDTLWAFYQDNGNIQQLFNVSANQLLTVVDGSCTFAPSITFNFPTDSNNVCGVTSTVITAPAGFLKYNWSTGDTTPDVTITQEGWYFCTVTNDKECTATDSIFVGFGVGYVTPADTIVCKGSPVTLNAFPRYDCSPFGAPAKNQVVHPDFIDAGIFNGHHYYLYNRAGRWSDAARVALNSGAYLAVINDPLEQNFIETNIAFENKNLWIGLYNERNNPFVWMNCDTLNYTNWTTSDGYPKGDVTSNYVFLSSSSCTNPFQWKNTNENGVPGNPCEDEFYAIVEFDEKTNVDYLWSNGETTPTIIVNPNSTQNYTVTIRQKGNTCIGAANVNVIDVGNLIPLDTITECKSTSVFIQATEGLKSYSWSNGRTTSGILVFSGGWYKVTATSNEDCVGTDSVFVVLSNTSIRTPDTTLCLGATAFLRGPNSPFLFQTDYTQNFQSLSYPGWSTNSSLNFNGSRVMGPFANDSVTFNLVDLPTHDSIMVTFDLLIHDTWEGDCSLNGPDRFRFKNGLTNVMNVTFSNSITCTQTYNANGTAGSFPAFTDATQTNLPRRCDNNGITTRYRITRKFRHTTSTLDLSWVGDLRDLQDNSAKCNESWTLDNVTIDIRRAGNLLWSTGDTTQNIFVTPTDPITEYWVRVPVGGSFCYDTVVVTTIQGNLNVNLITSDTLRFCFSTTNQVANINVSDKYDSYLWNTGDITNSIDVYNTGWYKVIAGLAQGCYAIDSVYMPFNKLRVAPEDTTVCLGNPVVLRVDDNKDCSPYGGPAKLNGYNPGDPIPGYSYKGEYKGHYYYQADAPSSWSTAAQNALAAGGHLVNILDTGEQFFVSNATTDNIWTGLYFNNALGHYIWMNCDTLTYTNWAASEPTATPEDYVYIYNPTCSEPGKWNSQIDDPSAITDPCLSNIYGMMEIVVPQYEYTWYDRAFNLVSTNDTVMLNPTADGLYRGFHASFIGGPNCFSGTSNITVISENFFIYQDSVEKLDCSGDTAMLVAAPGFPNYSWDNGETTQIAVYSNKIGWVYCTYDNGTCKFMDSVWVNLPGKLNPSIIKQDITCKGANDGMGIGYATDGTQPYSYLWPDIGSTDSAQMNLAPGKYALVVTDANGCIEYDTLEITQPDSALTVFGSILRGVQCNGDSNAILVPQVSGGTPAYTGVWTGFTANDTLWSVPKGTYTYTVSDIRGCTTSVDVTVNEPEKLVGSITTIKQIFCEEDSNGVLVLGASGGTLPYRLFWNGTQFTDDTLKDVYYGNFVYIVNDTNGCRDSLYYSMKASNTDPDLCGLVVPAGFTPNNDGKNDLFYIKGLISYPENELTIFNRWGESVYTATDYKNDWNGKSDRSLLNSADGLVPNDTYYYVLKTKANNKIYSGYVYITR